LTDTRKKIDNTKFLENPSSGSRTVRCGRTDRSDVANTLRKRLSSQASDKLLELQRWLSRDRPKPSTITQGSLPAPYPLPRELDRCQIAQLRPAGFH